MFLHEGVEQRDVVVVQRPHVDVFFEVGGVRFVVRERQVHLLGQLHGFGVRQQADKAELFAFGARSHSLDPWSRPGFSRYRRRS